MRTVVVLGAGASAGSQWAAAPMVKNFFRKADELGVSQKEEFEVLWRRLDHELGISRDKLPLLEESGFVTIEQLYSHVATLVTDEDEGETQDPQVLFERFIYSVLSESTKVYKEKSCPYHERLFSVIKPISIINFNYDLIADKALASVWPGWEEHIIAGFHRVYAGNQFVETGRNWWHTEESDMELESLAASGLISPEPTKPGRNQEFPKYLKLHGSLNWYYDVTRFEQRRAGRRWMTVTTLYIVPLRFAFDVGRIYQRRAARDYLFSTLQTSPPGPLPDEGADLQLAIVPPVFHKDYPQIVQTKWERARRALQEAERIIFVGYSIPPIDLAADKLFRTCYAGNKHRGKVIVEVVNPDATILEKIRLMYSESTVTRVGNTLKDYVDRLT